LATKLTLSGSIEHPTTRAVLAKLGIPVTHSDVFGKGGKAWLAELPLPQPYRGKVGSLRSLIEVYLHRRNRPAGGGHRPAAARQVAGGWSSARTGVTA
jgi:hypothetical protein